MNTNNWINNLLNEDPNQISFDEIGSKYGKQAMEDLAKLGIKTTSGKLALVHINAPWYKKVSEFIMEVARLQK